MPNSIGPTGLTLATREELIAFYTLQFQTIYGADIDLSSNSPDGQIINLFVQSVLDLQDLLAQIYNQFDPDNAIGVILDQRVAINGIQREGGTFTLQPVSLVISQAINLYGLDQTAQPIYTVADQAGNNWFLAESISISTPGTYSLSFRAENPGAVQSAINTITVPVSIVVGVTSINNPATYTTLGVAEESDANLKIRRQKSVQLGSQGYHGSLIAALANITGVTGAFVYENTSNTTNGDGVPGHSIWVVVGGSADPALIADAIYKKRNAGCGMFGAQSYTIVQLDGTPFTVYWDDVTTQALYIRFTATSLNGIDPPNISLLRSQIPVLLTPGVFDQVNTNQLAAVIQQIDSNSLMTNAGFSLAPTGPFTATLTPSSKDRQFVILSANVIILPIILSPVTVTVASGGAQQQFTPLGGFGSYTYAVISGAGSVDGNGLYTSAGAGTDVVEVTDSLGNTATATVTVTP